MGEMGISLKELLHLNSNKYHDSFIIRNFILHVELYVWLVINFTFLLVQLRSCAVTKILLVTIQLVRIN